MKIYNTRGQAAGVPELADEYRGARAFGNVRVGKAHLFFRAGLRMYAVGWGELSRCYRQVMRVPMKMCCGAGSLDVESLVLEGESGQIARIQLPGSRAARALMDVMKATAPGLDYMPPAKDGAMEAKA